MLGREGSVTPKFRLLCTLIAASAALSGCWDQGRRTPPPELTGRYQDTAVVARPMSGYSLWYKRDFLFTAGGADGMIDFFGDPDGKLLTLSAHVAGTYELGAPTAPGDYPARIRFTSIQLIPRAPYMVTLLGSGPCGPGSWALDQPGEVVATGCKPLGFTLPTYERVRVVGREVGIGDEAPLVRAGP
jgi:hypothetical protein